MEIADGIMHFCLSVWPNGERLWMKIEGDQIFLGGKCLAGVQVTPDMRALAAQLHHDLARCGQDEGKAYDLRVKFALALYEMMPPESEGKKEFGRTGLISLI